MGLIFISSFVLKRDDVFSLKSMTSDYEYNQTLLVVVYLPLVILVRTIMAEYVGAVLGAISTLILGRGGGKWKKVTSL